MIFAVDKALYEDRQFQYHISLNSHQNIDISKSRFPRYKDPIKDTLEFKQKEDEFYLRQFGNIDKAEKKGDN